jgi:hypothetical protein
MGRYSASAGPATAGFFLPNLVDSDSHIGSHCLLHFPATLPTQRPAPRGLRIAEKSPGCLLQFYKAERTRGLSENRDPLVARYLKLELISPRSTVSSEWAGTRPPPVQPPLDSSVFLLVDPAVTPEPHRPLRFPATPPALRSADC